MKTEKIPYLTRALFYLLIVEVLLAMTKIDGKNPVNLQFLKWAIIITFIIFVISFVSYFILLKSKEVNS
jgi:hypothetical protein